MVKKILKGQSLIEGLVALAIASIVIIAIASVVSSSVGTARTTELKNRATELAQEGMEIARSERSAQSGFYCLGEGESLSDPVSPSVCENKANVENVYSRSVTISEDSSLCGQGTREVVVAVAWADSKCQNSEYCQNVTLSTCLTAGGVIAGDYPFGPTSPPTNTPTLVPGANTPTPTNTPTRTPTRTPTNTPRPPTNTPTRTPSPTPTTPPVVATANVSTSPQYYTSSCTYSSSNCKRSTLFLVKSGHDIRVTKVSCTGCNAKLWRIFNSTSGFVDGSVIAEGSTFSGTNTRTATLSTPITLEAGKYYTLSFYIDTTSATFKIRDNGTTVPDTTYVTFKQARNVTSDVTVNPGAYDIALTFVPL